MREFFGEIKEEFLDFIDDFGDLLKNRRRQDHREEKPAVIGGQLNFVRPAYLFAERVENAIKIIFGGSILLSAITSTIVGFSSISDLIDLLVENWAGRAAMIIIGFSYVMIASWKILHLNRGKERL